MLFTHLARILAVLVFLLGVGMIFAGYQIAQLPRTAENLAAFGRSGSKIDLGVISIVAAIALGTLSEISFSLRKFSKIQSETLPDEGTILRSPDSFRHERPPARSAVERRSEGAGEMRSRCADTGSVR